MKRPSDRESKMEKANRNKTESYLSFVQPLKYPNNFLKSPLHHRHILIINQKLLRSRHFLAAIASIGNLKNRWFHLVFARPEKRA